MNDHDRRFRLRDGRLLGFAEYGDPGGRPLLDFHGWPGSRLEGGIGHAAKPDKRAFERPKFREGLRRGMLEAIRQGPRGVFHDGYIYTRPWGFRLEEIKIAVHLWQGDLDRTVATSMGRYMARVIPNCHARFFPDEGHLSLVRNHLREILKAAVA